MPRKGKLTDGQVREIRALRNTGETERMFGKASVPTIPELAKRYGVSPNAIAQILNGVTYKHVFDDSGHEWGDPGF